LTDFEIQTLAQHKSAGIVEHYSHGKQAIDFAAMRKRLEAGMKAPLDGTDRESEKSFSGSVC
jgi:hypothetical protein